jgi:hypothetical protein
MHIEAKVKSRKPNSGRIRRTIIRCLISPIAAGALAVAANAAGDSPDAPIVTSSPELALVAAAGDTIQLTATAVGSPMPTVQWQVAPRRAGPWTDIPGAMSTTLTVVSTTDPASPFAVGNAFRAIFANAAGTATSRPTKLVRRTNWMADLRSEIGQIPLTELTIPGAHDMGTYAINGDSSTSSDGQASDIGCFLGHGVCERYGRAQEPFKDALEDLQDGIRYFDLRVCRTDSGTFVTCHGLEAAPLQDILDGTRAWVDSHPGEVVILDLNHHYLPPDGNPATPDAEAALIEQTFSLTGGGSLLIPPQYCTPGDATSATCAGALTLDRIVAQHLGSVIVNFENDDAPGECVRFVNGICALFRQPVWGADFYDAHPLFWGRSAQPPVSFAGAGMCTPGAAFPSCFGASPSVGLVLGEVLDRLAARGEVSDGNRFFVQFLQTTPDGHFIENNLGGGLLDMALDSNPFIGPEVFHFGPFMPENLNVLALNYYDITVYGPITFDFVDEILRVDQDARTPPVIHVGSLFEPAATGWYNDATLASHGDKLQVDFSARDYRYTTGIHAFTCTNRVDSTTLNFGGILPPFDVVLGNDQFTDGVYVFDCAAEDGATKGINAHGNRGAGFGSTAFPAVFKVDTTPPVIRCADTQLVLHQPAVVQGTVTDATSGPAAATVSAPADTTAVGTFSVTVNAADIAGNAATATCPYTVGYRIGLDYDSSKAGMSGSTVTLHVELLDFFGNPVSDSTVDLTAQIVTNLSTNATFVPVQPGKDDLVFARTGGAFTYLLKTTDYPPGPYALSFVASADPGVHAAPFVLR